MLKWSAARGSVRDRKSLAAISLVEILVVLAVLAALLILMLPTLLRSHQLSRQGVCVQNLRQLQTAHLVYALDSDDRLVPNDYVYDARYIDAPIATGPSWCLGNARIDINGSQIERGALFPYLQSVAVYRCPSDPGRVALPDGASVARTRSYNLSIWLNTRPDLLASYTRLSEIHDPSPSDCFSFLDVHEDGIEDPTFGLFPWESKWGRTWLDLPADRHGQGADLAFVDGHAEHWRWKAAKRFVRFLQPPRRTDGDLEDFRRLQTGIPSWTTVRARSGRAQMSTR
jgi:prepilin-type processing-associated H-X9-DG protein